MTRAFSSRALSAAVILTLSVVVLSARQNAVAIDGDDIGGVVTSDKGPEAGVWVIAETQDLPTRFVKIVVTNGRSSRRPPGAR